MAKYSIQPLQEIDFSKVREFLNQEARLLEREDFFLVPSDELLERCLSVKHGISFGAFAKKRLVGIRLSSIPVLRNENLGHDLSYSEETMLTVAQFHGTLINARFRNDGIGPELILANANEIFDRGFKMILVTCHPENVPSLTMLANCGFVEVGRKKTERGWDRVILRLTRIAFISPRSLH